MENRATRGDLAASLIIEVGLFGVRCEFEQSRRQDQTVSVLEK